MTQPQWEGKDRHCERFEVSRRLFGIHDFLCLKPKVLSPLKDVCMFPVCFSKFPEPSHLAARRSGTFQHAAPHLLSDSIA